MKNQNDFEERLIDATTAERAGLMPVTVGFAPSEFDMLARAAGHFPPATRAFVLNGGKVEVWRPESEISRWSQKEEVNGSTAIRLRGTGTRRSPGATTKPRTNDE